MTLKRLLGKYDRNLRKAYRKQVRQDGDFVGAVAVTDFYESASSAIKAAKGFISSKGERNLLPLFLLCKDYFYKNEKVSRQGLVNFFSGENTDLFQCEALPVLLYAAASAVICENLDGGREDLIRACVSNLFYLREIPFSDMVFELNSAERILLEDPTEEYEKMSAETKKVYRRAVVRQAEAEGISEKEYAKKVLLKAKEKNRHIGFFMPVKENRIKKGWLYIAAEWLAAFVISLAAAFAAHGNILISLLLFLPVYSVIKPISDAVAAKLFLPSPVFSMDRALVTSCPVLITVTSLLPKKDEAEKLYSHLSDIYSSVFIPGVKLLFLADLKNSSSPERRGDKEDIDAVKDVIERLNKKYSGGFSLIVRERVFSSSEGEFTGFERKRGALCSLMRFLRDGNAEVFGTVFGDTTGFSEMKYIMALDSDTEMKFDSLRDLFSVASHPLNKGQFDSRKKRVTSGFGIFSPLVSSSVSSSRKTVFSGIFTEGGASSYIASVSERYSDMFGEGIFSGKGLIDIELFDTAVGDKFDRGRILSHDILEGAVIRTCFCPAVQLTDSFPSSPDSWFSRLHRWIRGDIQNLKYLFFPLGKEKLSPSLSVLGKYLLLDNLRRAVTPVICFILLVMSCFFNPVLSAICGILAVLGVISDSLFTVIKIIVRKGIFSFLTFRKSMGITVFYREILRAASGAGALPTLAGVSFDAVSRAVYRSVFSKKKLLLWCTASDREKQKKRSIFTGMILPVLTAGVLLLFGSVIHRLAAVMMLLFIPLTVFDGIKIQKKKPELSGEEKRIIESYISQMWSFFDENVTVYENFLPPDNIAEYPEKRTAAYTSPTNIGLYLVCVLAAADMKLISDGEMLGRINSTLDTIERLPKYKGHLFNWYDIVKAVPAPPRFVSSVDCGNYLVCLCALREGLLEYGSKTAEKTALRIEKILYESNLSVFYSKTRELFSIGIDSDTGEKHSSYYEHYMSESRMGSFLAVARRQVSSNHWQTLDRSLRRCGFYEAPLSWTGTMFEYFMPRLFLPAPLCTFHREGLELCLHLQKKRAKKEGIPYGISESGFYETDEMGNYSYKAHGIRALAVKKDADCESVMSPYSVFLGMPLAPNTALRNLSHFSALHITGRYGFYEAADFSEERTGGEAAAVRSFMSHHIGMSMIAAVNTLKDDIFVKRFMRDVYMNSAKSLLEEKISSDI